MGQRAVRPVRDIAVGEFRRERPRGTAHIKRPKDVVEVVHDARCGTLITGPTVAARQRAHNGATGAGAEHTA
eukprot:gene28935-55725_t